MNLSTQELVDKREMNRQLRSATKKRASKKPAKTSSKFVSTLVDAAPRDEFQKRLDEFQKELSGLLKQEIAAAVRRAVREIKRG